MKFKWQGLWLRGLKKITKQLIKEKPWWQFWGKDQFCESEELICEVAVSGDVHGEQGEKLKIGDLYVSPLGMLRVTDIGRQNHDLLPPDRRIHHVTFTREENGMISIEPGILMSLSTFTVKKADIPEGTF